MILISLALAAAQTPAMPQGPAAPVATAQPPSAEETRYRRCVAMVRSEPESAVGSANAWLLERGGIPARQCLGLAYVALERWDAAAAAYEVAAREAEAAQDPRRADLWVQSGNAWLAGAQPARAMAAFEAALATPDLTDELRGEVHLDRARAMVATGNAAGARQEIDRALQLVAADPFAWYLSAALAQRQGDLVRARADVARAVQLAPDDPEIMLLAGTLAGLAGDMVEAERLYRRVAEAAPDSEAGRRARASLDTLREVEVPAAAAAQPVPSPTPAPAPRPDQSR